MPDTASKMPARIWAGPRTGWTADRTALFEKDTVYIRADLFEMLAGAASKFVAVCCDKRGEWNGMSFIDPGALMDSFVDVRDALTSYREATND